MHIDLNCDLGEGFPHDAELLPLITSVNIACGGHAGDLTTMTRTLSAAAQSGVQVGAYPSFLDREHFGRRDLNLPPDQIQQECSTQIGLLRSLADLYSFRIRYVKPHGALYNLACRDEAFAKPVIAAAQSHELAIMGLPDSQLEKLSQTAGCPFIREGFADRRYRPDGSLVPRSEPKAFIETPAEAVEQAVWLVREKGVQSLCVHGDNPQALAFVQTLRQALLDAGFILRPFSVE